MNGDLVIFTAIFMVALVGLCGGVALFALHRISNASTALWHRHHFGRLPVAIRRRQHRVTKRIL